MAITRPELLELKNCELYDHRGETMEPGDCDQCHYSPMCWYSDCDDYEEAMEHHIDRELAGRQLPTKLIDGEVY